MNHHPHHLPASSIRSTYVPSGTSLRRLNSNHKIRLGDYMTATDNPPGGGLMPVDSYMINQKASAIRCLTFYRPTSTPKTNS